MTRFNDNEEGIPWGMWESIVGNALSGRHGQELLAGMEAALLALPEKKLISSHLALDGQVCAVGAYAAMKKAEELRVDIQTAIDKMDEESWCTCRHRRVTHAGGGPCSAMAHRYGREKDEPCTCERFEADTESDYETVDEGVQAGMKKSLAWHFAWLNDEQYATLSPEQRYDEILAYCRRAQGKQPVAA